MNFVTNFQDSEDDSDEEENEAGDGSATDDVIKKAKEEAKAIEDDAKEDYYSIAHTVSEQISAQPTILIGGSLKEYQIKG
jgi:ATP-dependent helicase STH1/SNF2